MKTLTKTLIASLFASSAIYATDYTWWGESFDMVQDPAVATGTGDKVSGYTGTASTTVDFNAYTNWKDATGDITFTSSDNLDLSFDVLPSVTYTMQLTENTTVGDLTINNLRHFQQTSYNSSIKLTTGSTSATLTAENVNIQGNSTISGTSTTWLNLIVNDTLYLAGQPTGTDPNAETTSVSWFTANLGSWDTKTSINIKNLTTYTHSSLTFITDFEDGSASYIDNFYISTSWTAAPTSISYSKITIDKFTSSGTGSKLNLSNSTLTLTGTSEFKGVLSITGTSEIIIANGADQTFSGTSSGDYTVTYTIQEGGKLTVNSATAAAIVNAGTLKVGDDSVDAKSLVVADGATLLFDLSLYNDEAMLAIVGTFSKETQTDTIYLDFDNFDSAELDQTSYALISFDNTDLSDTSLALTVDDFILSEALTEAGWAITQSSDSSFALTQVPEPSTYALIFGTLALGLAYYRRRK